MSLIPFARLSGSETIVCVDDVPRGRQCNCICISCGVPLIARQGDINEHCFAHDPDATPAGHQCDVSPVTVMRMLMVQLLPGLEQIRLFNGEMVQIVRWQVDVNEPGRKADALAMLATGQTLLIEVPPPGRLDRRMNSTHQDDIGMQLSPGIAWTECYGMTRYTESRIRELIRESMIIRSAMPVTAIDPKPADPVSQPGAGEDDEEDIQINPPPLVNCQMCNTPTPTPPICDRCQSDLIVIPGTGFSSIIAVSHWIADGAPGHQALYEKIRQYRQRFDRSTPLQVEDHLRIGAAIYCQCGRPKSFDANGKLVCWYCQNSLHRIPLSLEDWEARLRDSMVLRGVPTLSGPRDIMLSRVIEHSGHSAIDFAPTTVITAGDERCFSIMPMTDRGLLAEGGIRPEDVHEDFRPILLAFKDCYRWGPVKKS